jgi:hypothetical protein
MIFARSEMEKASKFAYKSSFMLFSLIKIKFLSQARAASTHLAGDLQHVCRIFETADKCGQDYEVRPSNSPELLCVLEISGLHFSKTE